MRLSLPTELDTVRRRNGLCTAGSVSGIIMKEKQEFGGRLFGLVAALLTVSTLSIAQQKDDLHDHAAMHAKLGMQTAEISVGHANLCDLNMTFRNVNRLRTDPPREPAASQGTRPAGGNAGRRQSPPVAPMQIFDNLYFVGNAGVSAWLLGTEDGYVLIDAMNSDDDAKTIIEAGILELGLDPNKIEYLLISHAHGDHFGGYRYIKETYDPRIVMSETDWVLASMLQEHPRFGLPPDRDYSVVDGDQLTVATTTIDIYVTPGHTMGTISPVFTVYDDGKPYRAAMWGGTGFNFGPNLGQMNAYAASAKRMRALAEEQNIEVFLANHPRRDGSLERMNKLAQRGADDPHSFVDQALVFAAFDTLHQCALAQADRIAAGDL